MGGRITTTGSEIFIQLWWTINIDLIRIASQAATGEKTHQAKDVVTMHMGDKNAAELADFQITPQDLMLGSFATVKQPQFCPLRQTQGNARNIARSRRYTGTRP